MRTSDEIKEAVLAFIREEWPDKRLALRDSPPLLSSGILDSLAVIALVTFLEDTFEIALEVEDLTGESFATIESIVALVEKRQETNKAA